MKKIFALLMMIGLLAITFNVHVVDAAGPCQYMIIDGFIKDKHGNNMGGIIVYVKNMRTGTIATNATTNYPVTATEGYRVDLGAMSPCWNIGDTIKLYSWYSEAGGNYSGYRTEIIPSDIAAQGYIINDADITLNHYEGSSGNPPPNETNYTSFYVYGYITNSSGNIIKGGTVKVINKATNDMLTNITDATGLYSVNLKLFPKGWKANDEIHVNISYKGEYGYFYFRIRVTQTSKRVDIRTIKTNENETQRPVITYEELFKRLNQTAGMLEDADANIVYLDGVIVLLQNLTEQQNQTIQDLEAQLPCPCSQQKGIGIEVYVIIVFVIIGIVLFYLWYTSKHGRGKQVEEPEEEPRKTIPIKRRR